VRLVPCAVGVVVAARDVAVLRMAVSAAGVEAVGVRCADTAVAAHLADMLRSRSRHRSRTGGRGG
jgi:hypothetical protein